MLKPGIITQARMGSTRLPGKILLSARGKTVLEHHIHRLKWAKIPIYVATTVNDADDQVAKYAEKLAVPCYRGDENNVLERFYKCAEEFALDVVIRVTSDCPLIDGNLVADAYDKYLIAGDRNLYYSNALERTFPRGLDFEIFSFDLLRDAYVHASSDSEKEHVTPYIHQNRSGRVSYLHYKLTENHSGHRWTLDTEDDWKLLRTLLEDYEVADLPYLEILKIVEKHPEFASFNNHIKQKEIDL